MRAFLFVSLASGLALAPGCGLTLDYGPPDPGGMDGGAVDAAIACSGDPDCDDGLACTAGACRDGLCVFDSLCPSGLDCIARGPAGECRRPCTTEMDCDDGIDCTSHECLADGHCDLHSTCEAERPVCLDNGACAPTTCSTNDECADQDPCNGIEQCVESVCVAGAPTVCEPSEEGSCIQNECDPVHGGCVPVLRSELCDDGVSCTVDTCTNAGMDGSHCEHRPVTSLCDSSNPCKTVTCDAELDCVYADVLCPFDEGSCILSAECDPTSGVCAYDHEACAAGEVCTDDGCRSDTCEVDTDCDDLSSGSGCGFRCERSSCVPLAACPPSLGCAVPVEACVEDASLCEMTGDALEAIDHCDDGDPDTVDRCVPDAARETFYCEHTCQDEPGDCVTRHFDPSVRTCVEDRDDGICASLHGATRRPDCTDWLCTGGGGDGCELRPVPRYCDDGASCTLDVCSTSGGPGGTCEHMPRDVLCMDGAACTLDVCDPIDARGVSGCVHVADDTRCVASVPGTDLPCASVACTGGPTSVVLGGVPLPTGCTVRYRACSGGPCTGMCPDAGGLLGDAGVSAGTTICEPTTGECVVPGRCETGIDCDDGNRCNGLEACVARVCMPGTPVACMAIGGCLSACNPRTGACERPMAAECVDAP